MDLATEQFVARVRLDTDPIADERAQVRVGDARFTVLTDRLLRLEWSADGAFEDLGSYSFPHRKAPVPTFTQSIDGDTTVIDTGSLVLRHTPDGRPLHAGNTSIELIGELGAVWTPGTIDPHNLGGARRTVDGCRGEARLEPGLVSRSGWALHDDSAVPLFGPDGWVQARDAGKDQQDWYFFGYGHDYEAAVSDYTRFGGAVPLVPRWILGAWWSRYWAYRDSELRELVDDFRTHDFPLDVVVIDMDWHLTGSWTGYTWNRELFPDPAEFLAWLHERGLHATLNLHPALGVQHFEDAYPEFATAMGVDPQSQQPVPFRIGDRDFVRNYFELLHHPLEDEGVDFWWMDWQQGRSSDGGVDPLPWLNHLHFQDMLRLPDRRPIDFSRWGGLGSHRYPVGFSGDSFSTWDSLAFQPRYTAAGANVAYGWWSHDIGGHIGVDDPELFVRWVQFGAMSPVLRLHSTNHPSFERRPWTFGDEATEAARQAFELRYQLLPYLYTAARHNADTGVAPVRPMPWLAPDDDAAYAARNQYLLGPDLLVAPVVEPADPRTGTADVDVWLPAGSWIERTTGERFTGPRWTRQAADLMRVPQFVRPGTVLPLADIGAAASSMPTDHLILSVFPGADGSTRVYEDDGSTAAFRDGGFSWTEVALASHDPAQAVVDIAAATGEGDRRYTVRFEHTGRPTRVLVDGVETTDWQHENGALVVPVPTRARSHATRVELIGDAVVIARDDVMAPLARVFEFTAPDDAAQQLGRVLAAGDDATVTARWEYASADGVRTVDVGPAAVTRAGVLLDAPFAWDGALAPARWSVDVEVGSAAGTARTPHEATTLFPCFASWRAIVSLPNDEPPINAVLAQDPALAWQIWRDDPYDLDYASLTQRSEIHPPEADNIPASEGVIDLFATLDVTAGCDVALDYWSSDAVEMYVDGTSIRTDINDNPPSAKYDLVRLARRTETIYLDAGAHTLVVRCRKGIEPPWGIWGLGVSAVDPAGGSVLLGVRAR